MISDRTIFINHLDDETRQQLIDHLKVLQVSDDCAERIMNAVERMPGKDPIKGALKFLTKITNEKSKREDYYRHSKFIAEFFCTISNLGLFAVGIYYADFATLIAATFSALSHAVPLQRLNELDKIGVLVIFGKVLANYKLFMERPELLAWGAGALTVNLMDTVITKKYLDKIGPSLHVAWHLAAALALYKIDQASVEVTKAELQSIAGAVMTSTIPSFLDTTHQTITDHMSALSKTSQCMIL